MADELVALGAVDAQGILTMNVTEIVAAIQATPQTAPTLAQPPAGTAGSLRGQLSVMYADHSFYSDWALRSLAFIEER